MPGRYTATLVNDQDNLAVRPSSQHHTPEGQCAVGSPGWVGGHAIVLDYDNASVERLPFVVEQDAAGRATGLWMMGSLLSPPKR